MSFLDNWETEIAKHPNKCTMCKGVIKTGDAYVKHSYQSGAFVTTDKFHFGECSSKLKIDETKKQAIVESLNSKIEKLNVVKKVAMALPIV